MILRGPVTKKITLVMGMAVGEVDAGDDDVPRADGLALTVQHQAPISPMAGGGVGGGGGREGGGGVVGGEGGGGGRGMTLAVAALVGGGGLLFRGRGGGGQQDGPVAVHGPVMLVHGLCGCGQNGLQTAYLLHAVHGPVAQHLVHHLHAVGEGGGALGEGGQTVRPPH